MTGRIALYPTWRSVILMGAGGPVAVFLAFADRPSLWSVSLLWIGATMALVAFDAAVGRSAMRIDVAAAEVLEAGGRGGDVVATLRGAPRRTVDIALETDELLDVDPARRSIMPGGEAASFHVTPRRRGRGLLRALHVRWRGPLGLVWTQRVQRLDRAISVVPNISSVKEEALRLFSRSREVGTATQTDLATSLEFHALRDFQSGDDNRTINWRQSARHRTLLVRETQAERNRTVIFAFDTGRLMCEPLEGGVPRLDHAINAALLMAYVGLKSGDRVGLFAFDAQPGVSSPTTAGVAAFAPFQRLAAGIDYTTEETNFTLGLSQLAGRLRARALVVIFTEFADSTGAALMVDSIGRLLKPHLVLFVTFRDGELEAMVRAEPEQPSDVSRAVVAGGLLREREAVLGRLRRLGVEVIDAPARAVGPALMRRYLLLKREDRF